MTKEKLQEFINETLDSQDNDVDDCNSFMAGVNEGIREVCEKLQQIIDLK
jgi:endonuclease IV